LIVLLLTVPLYFIWRWIYKKVIKVHHKNIFVWGIIIFTAPLLGINRESLTVT